jgi:hypothetical protein
VLYILGPFVFEVAPFNVNAITKSSTTDYAWKPIFGGPKPAEYVGEGSETIQMQGRLFPEALGGLHEMKQLQGMRSNGLPHPLMRGDGERLGWFVIEKIEEQSTHLDQSGVPRMIEFQIDLRRSWAPSPSDYAEWSLILGHGLSEGAMVREATWGK